MMDEEIIDKAAKLLLEAAPGSKVILFGSHTRGDADPKSDVDFLVVEPEVKDRIGEMVRLDEVLHPLPIAVDILVASAEHFDYWKDTPNTVYYRPVKEGRTYEQVA